jgi:hypothetical protein
LIALVVPNNSFLGEPFIGSKFLEIYDRRLMIHSDFSNALGQLGKVAVVIARVGELRSGVFALAWDHHDDTATFAFEIFDEFMVAFEELIAFGLAAMGFVFAVAKDCQVRGGEFEVTHEALVPIGSRAKNGSGIAEDGVSTPAHISERHAGDFEGEHHFEPGVVMHPLDPTASD